MATSFAFITFKFYLRHTTYSLAYMTFRKLLVNKAYLLGIFHNNIPIGLYIHSYYIIPNE
jgi:hypothetical protein